MWWLLCLLGGLGVGYYKGRTAKADHNLIAGLLGLVATIASFRAKPKTTFNTLVVNDHSARVCVQYRDKSHTLMFPVYRLQGRWDVKGSFKVAGSSVEEALKIMVTHRMEETYIVGLPYCAAHISADTITLNVIPTPDDGSTPLVHTFRDHEPLRLEDFVKVQDTPLQACD